MSSQFLNFWFYFVEAILRMPTDMDGAGIKFLSHKAVYDKEDCQPLPPPPPPPPFFSLRTMPDQGRGMGVSTTNQRLVYIDLPMCRDSMTLLP